MLGRDISRICKASKTFTGDTLKRAIKLFLYITEGISQLSRIPHHKHQKQILERSQRLVAGCALSEQCCYCGEGYAGAEPCRPLFLCLLFTLSVCLSASLYVCAMLSLSPSRSSPSLPGTKPRRTLGAGAAHSDAWLSLYHCLVT